LRSKQLVQNYLLGAEGVVINMKPVTWNNETVKGNNIIGNGLNIWILMLRIKLPCPGIGAEKRLFGDILQMFGRILL
jgi:hypothetical protein